MTLDEESAATYCYFFARLFNVKHISGSIYKLRCHVHSTPLWISISHV